jgi:protein translocase SecG subunit
MFLNILIIGGTLILLFVSLLMVLLILMQRPSPSAGLGSTLGGTAAESAFGSEANNVLMRITVWFTIAFFVLSLGLSLSHLAQKKKAYAQAPILPVIQADSHYSDLTLPTDNTVIEANRDTDSIEISVPTELDAIEYTQTKENPDTTFDINKTLDSDTEFPEFISPVENNSVEETHSAEYPPAANELDGISQEF